MMADINKNLISELFDSAVVNPRLRHNFDLRNPDDNGNETERIHLNPSLGNFGCVVPADAWHTVEVLEPSVIFEAKDGRYGEDGSETLVGSK